MRRFQPARALLLLCLFVCSPVAAQVTTEIPGEAGALSVAVWKAESDPVATVILLPGWGGGPADVMGLGETLSRRGIAVVVLNPRGWHDSEGTYTHPGALEDIASTLFWIRQSPDARAFDLNPDRLVLGGHSWGGGFSMAYAGSDASVREVFSIGGTDHAELGRRIGTDPDLTAMVHRILESTKAPAGPVRFDSDDIEVFVREPEVYGIRENAVRLADRSILLLGGWEDVNVTIDDTLLPVYRTLKAAGAEDVTFLTYHANHGFGPPVRSEMQTDIGDWILSR